MIWRLFCVLASTQVVKTAFRYPISCFSCASEEYRPLYQNSPMLQSIGQPVRFDKICDTQEDVKTFAPAVACDSACVTVLEPQFFGGVLNEQQPYKFIRGCATDIFALAISRPAEVEFMHATEICLLVPLSEIWPEVLSNDLVNVCSCTTSSCNTHDYVNSSTFKYPNYGTLFVFFVLFQILFRL